MSLRHSVTPLGQAMQRYAQHKLAVVAVIALVLIGSASLLGPVVHGVSATSIDLTSLETPPSQDHWLGTDSLGRDTLARLLAGGRVSLSVGVVAALVAIAVGMTLGSLAGNVGGRVDSVVMRAADVVLSFPALVVVVVLAGIVGPSLTVLIVAIGAFSWPEVARVVRGETLRLRELDFVKASRATGAGGVWIAVRHIWPAVLPPLIVVGTLLVARAILLEAGLSFLGLGVPPPTPSWGNMLQEAQSLRIIRQAPWLWIFPGTAITMTVLSVNLVGDGMQDASDPRGS